MLMIWAYFSNFSIFIFNFNWIVIIELLGESKVTHFFYPHVLTSDSLSIFKVITHKSEILTFFDPSRRKSTFIMYLVLFFMSSVRFDIRIMVPWYQNPKMEGSRIYTFQIHYDEQWEQYSCSFFSWRYSYTKCILL